MNLPQFHVPVLKNEVIHYLITDKSGIYVDGTLGGGGHSQAILEALNSKGQLIGIDRDEEAVKSAEKFLEKYHEQIILRQGNTAELSVILGREHIRKVDGILLDLGVSSYQIDTSERGFSYITNGPLDMRMSTGQQLTAEHVVNQFSQDELTQIFFEFGEEKFARSVAKAIVYHRRIHPINSTGQLADIIRRAVPFKLQIKSLSRIFQALRIKVNDELDNLSQVLKVSISLLNEGGRLVVISYHSLEDRIVKHFLQHQENPCICPPAFPICVCHKKPNFKILTKRVIMPSAAEVENNIRSRSARLRAAERKSWHGEDELTIFQ